MGVSVGDEAVRQTILGAEAFKGPNGKFDRTAYSQALRRESMAESDFEDEVRKDEARLMIQRAVAGGVVAPQAMVDRAAAWILEARDLSWAELTAEDLPAAIERALANRPALLDVLVTPEAVSSDAKSGLAWVPDLQPLTVWNDAETKWRGD